MSASPAAEMPDRHAPWRMHPRFADAITALNAKTKPIGALGQLETVAIQLACLQNTVTPSVDRARVLIFAADHGIADDGVSAYPKAVTREMVRNFGSGGAAICVFARSVDVELEVIDVGVDGDMAGLRALTHASVRRGTRNMRHEPAMTDLECGAACNVGRSAVRRARADGMQAILLGEMGIGNTTAAAALTSALTGAPPDLTVGRGTGLDDTAHARKIVIVREIVQRHCVTGASAREVLTAVGGLEIAALVGAMLEAADAGMAVLVDGYIVTAAALVACRIEPQCRPTLIFAHQGAEPGHSIALGALDAEPLLHLELRLGEGSGAALALPLVRAAARMMTEMATFESAGVSIATST